MDKRDELLEGFTEYLRTLKLSATTRQHYHNWTKFFLDNFEFNLDNIELRLNWLKENRSSSTYNAHLAALKLFCQWAYTEGYASWNYTSGFGTTKVQGKQIEPLSRQEVNKLRPLFDEPTEQILWVFLMIGLRKNELLNVTHSDITLGDKHSLVTVRLGKGQKERSVPVTNNLNKMLWELYNANQLAENLPLSERWGGQNSLNAFLRSKGKQANVKGSLHPHKFRRTFANSLVKQGMPIEQIQRLLGHGSILTTMRYINIRDSEIVEKLKKIDLG